MAGAGSAPTHLFGNCVMCTTTIRTSGRRCWNYRMFPAKPANALAGGVLSAASMSVSARSRPRDKVRGYVLRHGGFREGLTHAGGFVCVGHCEIDKYANRSYNALFDTEGEWYIEDARKADPSTMPDFQLLCGGFPCQSYPE